ncbi:hypothetical protein CPT_Sonora_066 [Stenotrophomonas phage Sonora]|nr:hypothetical protein CPT_Sonora_066 [Stenotrophomonas phage Sonora]
MTLFVFTPSPDVDHLDPANWWPHYSIESDRRAIPARAAMELGVPAYIMEESHDPGLRIERWDLHPDAADMSVWSGIVEGRGGPDMPVYISQEDFVRNWSKLQAALLHTFDSLWKYHQKGHISRIAFDARAADLRSFRDHITKMMEIRKHG